MDKRGLVSIRGWFCRAVIFGLAFGGQAQVYGQPPETGGQTPELLSHDPPRATIVATVLAPSGGGNHDPEIIRDGVKPAVGTTDSSQQYDTFTNNETPHEEFVGYLFDTMNQFTRVVFQEGMNFTDGGWFAGGSLRLQVLAGGIWSDVPAGNVLLDIPYPDGDYQGAFGAHFETYTFTLTDVQGQGLRLLGDAGGSKRFLSIGELEVWGTVGTSTDSELSHDPSRAAIVATVLAPSGGGNHDPEIIRDGVKPPVGTTDSSQQYDTFTNNETPHEEFVGYLFDTTHQFTRVVFQEGMNFTDGGWFAGGSLRLQVLVGGSWSDVPAGSVLLDIPYPEGDYQGAFGAHYETYTFTLTDVQGQGLRLLGDAGGSKRFLSIGELEVWGVDDTPAIITDVDGSSVDVPEGSTAWFQVKLSVAPTQDVMVTVARTAGDTDLAVGSGQSLWFTPTSWNVYQTVTLTAAEDADGSSGTATITLSSSGATSRAVTADEVDNDMPTIAHWPFDEGSGATAMDISDSQLHGTLSGTLSGGPQWLPGGQVGGALFFDGVDDRVLIPNPGPDFITDALTLALWVKPDHLVGIQGLVSKDGVFELETGRTVVDGQISLRINGQVPGGSAGRLRAGIWQHIGVSWSAQSGEIRFFINGAPDGVVPFSGGLGDTSAELGIGGRPDGVSFSYGGGLDDVRIYDRVLGLAEIAALAAGAPENQVPVAELAAGPLSGFAPLTVAFDGAASRDPDGSIEGFAWSFGDGASDSGAAVDHTYATGGFFTASLRVTDNQGATNVSALPIAVWTPGNIGVTVDGGNGSGQYAAGSQTVILADNPPTGQRFAGWSGDTVGLADPSFPRSVLTVQAADAVLTANYQPDQRPTGWRDFRQHHLDSGGEYLWRQHANWQDGSLPRGTDSVEVGDDFSLAVHAVVRSSGNTIEALEIAEGPDAAGSRLTVRSGDLTVGAIASGSVVVGKDAPGWLTVEGGLFHAFGPIRVGGPWSDARGTVHITGGNLIAEDEIRIGLDTVSPDAGKGSQVLIEGGALTSGGAITVSSSDASWPGILRVAGTGSLHDTFGGVVVLRGALEIDGPLASVDLVSLELGDVGARLRWTGTGISTIQAGDVSLGAGTVLDVGSLDVAAGSYLLIDGSSIVDGGLALAPGSDPDIWSFQIDAAAGDLLLTRGPDG